MFWCENCATRKAITCPWCEADACARCWACTTPGCSPSAGHGPLLPLPASETPASAGSGHDLNMANLEGLTWQMSR